MTADQNYRVQGFTDEHLENIRAALAQVIDHDQDELEALALQRVGEMFNALDFARNVLLAFNDDSPVVLATTGVYEGIDALDRLLPLIIRGRVTEGQPQRVQAALACADAMVAWEDALHALQPTDAAWGRIQRALKAYRQTVAQS